MGRALCSTHPWLVGLGRDLLHEGHLKLSGDVGLQIAIAGRMGGPSGLLDEIAHALGALGHQVLSYPDADAPGDVTWLGIDELLRTSDVVCVLASLNAETRGMLDAARLRLLKPGAVLVNTARGAIIDEAALYEVAAERPDLRLALDTFTVEPLPPDSPLRSLPNAILTPHMVGHTQESIAAVPVTAVENMRRILAGDLPLHICNPDVIALWRSRFIATATRTE